MSDKTATATKVKAPRKTRVVDKHEARARVRSRMARLEGQIERLNEEHASLAKSLETPAAPPAYPLTSTGE